MISRSNPHEGNKCPCKDCPDRTITCHRFCSRYKEWKAHIDEINAQKQLEKAGCPYRAFAPFWKQRNKNPRKIRP